MHPFQKVGKSQKENKFKKENGSDFDLGIQNVHQILITILVKLEANC